MEKISRWQIISLVIMIFASIILSITTEGCFSRSEDEEIGSSAPPETRTLNFTTQPVNTVAGITMTAVTVEVRDQYNNVMSGKVVSITATDNSIVISGTLVITSNASGLVTFSDLTITKTGTYTLKASVGSITQNSNAFNITASAINNYVVVPANSSVVSNSNQTATVTARDIYGNTVTPTSTTITMTITSVTGTLTVTFYTNISYGTTTTTYSYTGGSLTIYYKATHNGVPPNSFTMTATDSAAKYGTSGTVNVTN